ncbi:MAG: hypothetical protein ACQEXG_17030 [Pseudomonadota bacterium]
MGRNSHEADIMSLYVAPGIPKKKLVSSVSSISPDDIDYSEVVAVLDDTIFGSAKEGVLITDRKIYAKQKFKKGIHEVEIGEIKKVSSMGDKIYINDNEFFKATTLTSRDIKKFSDYLNKNILGADSKFKSHPRDEGAKFKDENIKKDPRKEVKEIIEKALLNMKNNDPGLKDFIQAFSLDKVVGEIFNLTSRHIPEIRKLCLVSTRRAPGATVETCILFSCFFLAGSLYTAFVSSNRVRFAIDNLLEDNEIYKSLFNGFFYSLIEEVVSDLAKSHNGYYLSHEELDALSMILLPLNDEVEISGRDYAIQIAGEFIDSTKDDPEKIVMEVEKIANNWYKNLIIGLDSRA